MYCKNVIVLDASKDEAGMVAMFMSIFTRNEDIINVHEGKTTKNSVYEPVECLDCVSLPKRQAKELLQAHWRCNGSLWNVLRYHRDMIMRPYLI